MMKMDKYVPMSPEYVVEPEDDLLDDVFGMRRKTLERKLELVREQILQRRETLEDNIKRIDNDLCLCSNTAFQLPEGDVRGQHTILLQYKFPLYREKRKNQTDYLRDIAMLQRELLDTKLQYLSLQDKQDLIK